MPNDPNGHDTDFDRINQYYEPLINQTPNDQSLWESWGTELFNLKKFDKAVEKYEKAESLGAKSLGLYWNWGAALANLGKPDEAVGKYEKAEELFKKTEEASPNYGYLYVDWGNALLAEEKFDFASEKFKIATRFDDTKVGAYFALGLISSIKQDLQTAKKNFEHAVKLNNENSLYHFWLANTLSYLMEYDASIREYEESLKFEIDDASRYVTYLNLGFALIEKDRFDEAIENFKSAEKLRRDDGILYVYWGDALREKHNTDLAIKKYKIAVKFEETKLEALLKWGNIYYDRKDAKSYKSALKKYEEIIAIDDQNVYAHYNIGLCSFYTGKYERAKESFKNAIRLDKENASYHTWLADTLLNLDEPRSAAVEYEEALRLEKDDASRYLLYRSLGIVLTELDEFDRAIENFIKAHKLRQDESSLYIYWGDVFAQKKELKLAIRKYKKAAEFEQSKALALLRWGNVYYDKKKYKLALKKYLKILSENDSDVDAHYNTGLSSFFLKNYQMAKEHFEQASELSSEESLYHYWLADTLVKLKDYNRAAVRYEEALKFDRDDKNKYNTYRTLGFVFGELSKSEKANEQFLTAEKLRDDDGALYIDWGDAFSKSYEFDSAEEKYRKASTFSASKFDALYALGYQKMFQKKYSEAREFFEEAISEKKDHPFTYYDNGYCFFKTGHYSKANENWEKSVEQFESLARDDKLNENSSYVYRFAVVSHYVYGQLEKAEKLYKEISEDLQPLEKFDTLSVYLELKDNIVDPDHTYHWRAHHEFKAIERFLKQEITDLENLQMKKKEAKSPEARDAIDDEISQKDEAYLNFYLGFLYFQMSLFEDASTYFEKAYQLKTSSENADDSLTEFFAQNAMRNALGNCYSNLGKHEKAISFIKRAKEEHPGDFEIQNNLASAYYRAYADAENDVVKARYLDATEKEFEAILSFAPNNIDAMIGLGYTKLEKSEFRKQDLYEDAVRIFEKVFDLTKSKKGSIRITNKSKIDLLYNLGYANIKMYESSNRFLPNEKLRKNANDYFLKVIELDEFHPSASRACALLKKDRIPLNPATFVEKFAHLIISFLAFLVFVLTFTSFFLKVPGKIDMGVGYFAALTFGSLIFLVAGLSLPQLLKLKVGSIELEKEIEKSTPIKEDFSFITRQRASFTSDIQGISKSKQRIKQPTKGEKQHFERPNEPIKPTEEEKAATKALTQSESAKHELNKNE